MRLPAFIFSVFSGLLLYIFIKRFFSFRIAVLALTAFSFSYNIFYYSIHGRGYSVLSFFIILSLFSLLKMLLSKGNSRFYAAIYIGSSVFGFYTIPVFLYPFLSMSVFGIWYLIKFKHAGIIKFIIVNFFIAAGVCILYAPVILFSGTSTITNNPWMTALSWEEFWNNLLNYLFVLGEYLLNLDQYGATFLAAVSLGGIILLVKQHRHFAWLCLFFFIVPFLIIIIQSLHPFVRVWDYLWLIIALFIALIINFVFSFFKNEKFKSWIFTIVLALFIFYGHRQVDQVNKRGFGYYVQLDSFIKKAFENNFSSAYISEDIYYLFISYYSGQRKKPMQLFWNATAEDPELVVLFISENFPSWLNVNQYQPFIQNTFIKSYRKMMANEPKVAI